MTAPPSYPIVLLAVIVSLSQVSALATVGCPPIFQRRTGRGSAAVLYSSSSSKENIRNIKVEVTVNGTQEAPKQPSTTSKRKPPFPIEAYPLAKDEANVKYNFISFIDQSFMSSYSQTVRLVEPRLYARPDQFRKENSQRPPTIEDVAEPKTCKLSYHHGRSVRMATFPPCIFVLAKLSIILYHYQPTENSPRSWPGMVYPLVSWWVP
jgi:hypothetical protein